MKIILSRKGFDSSSGGVPNPILPDGKLLSLPIPDSLSDIRYDQVSVDALHRYDSTLSALVEDLTQGRVSGSHGAHLDPDLCTGHFPRRKRWRPLLGQRGSALGHLVKQGVGCGDVFLFFGLFRPVELFQGRWRFVAATKAEHILWGWMQVEEVLTVSEAIERYPWVSYHPHCQEGASRSDRLYVSAGDDMSDINGRGFAAGVFPTVADTLRLTDPNARLPSAWRLPRWFYPEQKTPLSFHGKPQRWSRDQRYCYLQSVARGQEFVLVDNQYPQAKSWMRQLLARHGQTTIIKE